MGSYILGEPLGAPMQYDPSFKVEPCLDEPIWGSFSERSGVGFRIMTVCSQLEMLCQKELIQNAGKHAEQGVVSTSLETKGSLLLEKLKNLSIYLPQTNTTITDYLQKTGLSKLYPRATNYILNPSRPDLSIGSTEMDGYFPLLGKLNDLIRLASQINTDVKRRTNLKYIPHQLALLHQSLIVFKANETIAELKTNVESNFETLKTTLARKDCGGDPKIPDQHAQWLIEITQAVMDEAASLPKDMTATVLQPACILTNLT